MLHLPSVGCGNVALILCRLHYCCIYPMQITLLLHLHFCCTYSVWVELMAGCCRIRSGLMAGSTVSILHVFCVLNHVALPLGKGKNKAISLRKMTINKKPRCQRRPVFNSEHLLSRIVFFFGGGEWGGTSFSMLTHSMNHNFKEYPRIISPEHLTWL